MARHSPRRQGGAGTGGSRSRATRMLVDEIQKAVPAMQRLEWCRRSKRLNHPMLAQAIGDLHVALRDVIERLERDEQN